MSDTWTAISGYATAEYADTMVFKVDHGTKKLEKISGQTLVAGEENSQYIRFEMPRYWDGIDITGKTIKVVHMLANRYFGETATINGKYSDDMLQFGWVVPKTACCISGTLMFVIVVTGTDYVLKTQIAETPVAKSIDIDGTIPEPSKEAWYREFQARIDSVLQNAEDVAARAAEAAYLARSYVGAPLVANHVADMVDPERIYVYTGSEDGYTAGYWYHYDGSQTPPWVPGGIYNAVAVETDTTLRVAGKAADAEAVGDEITDLKEDLNIVPSVNDSDAEDVDLDVSDANGNVIVRFANGHIKTKYFDSEEINADTDTEIMSQITDSDADLYISDAQGKGLVRFADGHVQTAKFTSDNGVYKKVFEYTDTAGTATINHFFPKGTKLAFHLVRADVAGWGHLANYSVTYKYTGRDGIIHILGADYGYNFPTYTLPKDAVSVSVAYGTGLTQHETADLAFCVYPEASFKKQPKVITVSPDGSKDFTSIREAVDSIPFDVCELNPYEIHVYAGTYDILADYTAEEIGVEGFEGLFLNNGTSLIGIGQRDEIVLTASMDTDTYDTTKRNDVSTLNIYGNVHVENIVVKAYNIRYAVHDEGSMSTHKFNVHSFKNVKFYGENLTSGGGGVISYGAGCSSNKQIKLVDCDFSDMMIIHSQYNLSHEVAFYLENCSARRFRFTDYENANKRAHVYMRNCKAEVITVYQTTSGQSQSMTFDGIGECDALISCPAGYVYNFGCNREFFGVQISAGYAVKLNNALTDITVTTNRIQINGISIGTRDGNTVIQTSGYINSNILGLTGLTVGDYLTIDSTGKVVSGGTADNAVAVVKAVDNEGLAYAKLMI